MFDALLASMAAGGVLGLSAGAAPGPLLTLVITETLTSGPRAGIRVALAPLLSDPPIILLCSLLLAELSRFSAVLSAVSLVGGLVVLGLAADTWKATAPLPGAKPVRSFSLRKGVVTNLLNPHPYLFWLGVGAPLLVRGWRQNGPADPALFLLCFYVCLVGAKVAIALLTARSRSFLRGRAYAALLKFLAVALAGFGLLLLRDAWRIFLHGAP
ncbi:LysE family transporter [Paucidesulfovibrio longus]|uniref:LysE family transporter n=1 Tax=Paucidesulfovibrio longus TaxID=889 RepID=UPI0003B4F6DD|nr:LysE family transporter [Paucidesulfovibrio longus]